LQHLNQTTKTNPSILQFKCSYRKKNKLGGMLPSSTFIVTWRKKHKGLLASSIHCCKLKDKGGALQRRLLQNNNNEGDCVLPSPKYWLVLYYKKRRNKGMWCPSLDFLWSKWQHGGHDVLPTFLATWKNKTHRGTCCPLTFTIARWRQIINSMKFFVKKKEEEKKNKKLTSLKWLQCVTRNKKQGS
jgi:hypothetical protein